MEFRIREIYWLVKLSIGKYFCPSIFPNWKWHMAGISSMMKQLLVSHYLPAGCSSPAFENFLIKGQIDDNTSERNIWRAILFLLVEAPLFWFLNLLSWKLARVIETFPLSAVLRRFSMEFDDWMKLRQKQKHNIKQKEWWGRSKDTYFHIPYIMLINMYKFCAIYLPKLCCWQIQHRGLGSTSIIQWKQLADGCARQIRTYSREMRKWKFGGCWIYSGK